MDIAGATHTGKIRSNNEDAYLICSHNGLFLLIVADGMGGSNAGEVASRVAVNTIRDGFLSQSGDISEFLVRSVRNANKMILQQASDEIDKTGMGTTVDAVVIDKNKVYIAHVGDSRVYHYSGGVLSQVTVDHSYVQQLIDNGLLTSEEAESHPHKNLITRVLGGGEKTDADIIVRDWKPDDILLLCSDGLTNQVNNDVIKEIISCKGKAETKAEAMIRLANKRGGRDNVTVIIAQNREES